MCSRRDVVRRVRGGAAEAQARQAVLSLARLGRSLDSGYVLRLGPGPRISFGRDYPGALRRGGVILLSQVARSGRLLTGGPGRLVPGRDG